jgi:hypothetical protein
MHVTAAVAIVLVTAVAAIVSKSGAEVTLNRYNVTARITTDDDMISDVINAQG